MNQARWLNKPYLMKVDYVVNFFGSQSLDTDLNPDLIKRMIEIFDNEGFEKFVNEVSKMKGIHESCHLLKTG
jgi:hypothetical protein